MEARAGAIAEAEAKAKAEAEDSDYIYDYDDPHDPQNVDDREHPYNFFDEDEEALMNWATWNK